MEIYRPKNITPAEVLDEWRANPKSGDVTPYLELLDHVFGTDAAKRREWGVALAYRALHSEVKLPTLRIVDETGHSKKCPCLRALADTAAAVGVKIEVIQK